MTEMTDPDRLKLYLAAANSGLAVRHLLRRFGDASAVLQAGNSRLAAAGVSDRQQTALDDIGDDAIARLQGWLEQSGHHLIAFDDPRFPPQLADISGAPAALFALGDPALLALPSLAIVGSRNPTASGRDNARQFAGFLAGHGLAIVSGLADGIDAAAHQGALAADGATIAVLGTGIDICYPAVNRDLYQQIARDGVIVSEYPPGRPAQSWQFPARNRIISGLSQGTLVVEATIRSGSLITARLAGEQGRSVFAIPGSIHNPLARGCHQLIRQGALLVEQADDIFREIGPALSAALSSTSNVAGDPSQPPEANASADPDYQRLLDALGWDPAGIDELVARSGLTTAELSSMLLIMELDGLIETLPGGRYVRVANA